MRLIALISFLQIRKIFLLAEIGAMILYFIFIQSWHFLDEY